MCACVCRSPQLYYRTNNRALRALLQMFGFMADDTSAVSAAASAAEHSNSRIGNSVKLEPKLEPESAAAEHATRHLSDAGLDALSNFLSLGLQHYAVNLTLGDREYAIATALVASATKPGDGISIGQGAGDLVAQWWGFVAFETPKTTDKSNNFILYIYIYIYI